MYGIIDIGSNTIRLMLYNITGGTIQPMLNKKFTAGLAGYVKKGRMTDKGIGKTVEILDEFRRILEYVQVKELFCIATASLRNIDNAEEVCAAVKDRCGFDIHILSGEEEAVYDYYGAMQSVDEPGGLVIDIGGGSTEFVFYEEMRITASSSIPLGSLTAYSSFVKNILPTEKEEKAITAAVLSALEAVPGVGTPAVICGVGGSIRAAVKVYQELFGETLPKKRIPIDKLLLIRTVKQELLAKAVLKAAPERIHTFIPGLLILSTIAEKWNIAEITVSTSGVKEGYLQARLQEQGVL